MFFILLSIICSAAISVTMKIANRCGHSGIGILCVNYLFAAAFSLVNALRSGSIYTVTPTVLFLGVISGILFLGAFLVNQFSIIHNGAILSATAMKMGIVVPILLSWMLWNETASPLQTAGVLLAIIAILIMTWSPSGMSEVSASALWILPVLLLIAGSADCTSKLYAEYGLEEAQAWYMFLTFFTALILCLPLMILLHERFDAPKLGFGSVLGLVNYASSWFLLLAVAQYPAFFVYPIVNVLIIALITLISVIFFRERLNRRQIIGIFLVMVAVVLLNLQ